MDEVAQAAEAEAAATPVEDRQRWLALYVLCVGMLMIVLDATIVNVALPSIQEDLGFSQSNLAWVVNAYLIAFGGLLLLAGRIGDLIGQRRLDRAARRRCADRGDQLALDLLRQRADRHRDGATRSPVRRAPRGARAEG